MNTPHLENPKSIRRTALAAIIVCVCCGWHEVRAADEVSRTAVQGPLRLRVSAPNDQISIAHDVPLVVTVDAPADWKIQPLDAPQDLGDFVIVDQTTPPPRQAGERIVQKFELRLRPKRVGTAELPRFMATVIDAIAQRHVIETESLSLEIVTTVPGRADAVSLSDLKAPAGLAAEPARWPWRNWFIGLGSTFVILATVILTLVVRRARAADAELLSAEEVARRGLRDLLASDLAENDIKEFYQRLTGVVRAYIESRTEEWPAATTAGSPESSAPQVAVPHTKRAAARYSLVRSRWSLESNQGSPASSTPQVPAPKRTTDEFLREIADHRAFDESLRTALSEFLAAADLVKFAGVLPSADDVEQMTQRAATVIDVLANTAGGEDLCASKHDRVGALDNNREAGGEDGL
ncbi:MAG: hypothetical protein QGG36_29090 [Pirellulaceae bacterium]|jgi:hypothetical protein|nr:hypothetical protein [Pirellulaceae bacterium]MDP7019889.1 hypothetical protein [Pirellulaceae bacterium]